MLDFIQHFFSGVPYFFYLPGFSGMGLSNIYILFHRNSCLQQKIKVG